MEKEKNKDYRSRKCNLCATEEMMHKFDRFCKACKKGGKNKDDNKTYQLGTLQ